MDSASLPKLEDLRRAINEVDEALVALLNRRAALSLTVGRCKRADTTLATPVFRPARESELLHRLKLLNNANGTTLPDDHLLAIYREILSSSRALQRPQRIAYLGPEGTFSHLAARRLLGSQSLLSPKPGFGEIFAAIADGDCEFGVVPLENSREGSIGKVIDLLALYPDLRIQAETWQRIRHSLLSAQNDPAAITTIYSHAQPLAQCDIWLSAHLPHAIRIPMDSSAAAARRAANEPGTAALGHASLADGLPLAVLAEGIEDMPGNRTRFIVLGKADAERPANGKSSILFSVDDKPGSLARVLQCFADQGVNIRKLESRPMQGQNGAFVFFADLESNTPEASYSRAMDTAKVHCRLLRFLGCYPEF